MKKVSPQLLPSWRSVLEPEPTPTPLLARDPTPLPEPAPMVELAPMGEPEPMVETAPMVEPAPMVDLEPMAEPEPVVDPESYPTPKFVLESAPEEVKLLHEYQDPFLPPEPGFSAFTSSFGELFLGWLTDFLSIFSVARSAVVGLHRQLLEARLYHLNLRSSFSQPGSLMRTSFAKGGPT